MKTLITIASEQAWQQIITIAHLKPEKLIILHSSNEEKSKKPAERLKDFAHRIFSINDIVLEEIPSNIDFSIIEKYKYDDDIYVNLTGGTKDLSIMLFINSFYMDYRCFYFNYDSTIRYFNKTEDGAIDVTEIVSVDKSITNFIDPMEIAKLQAGEDKFLTEGFFYNTRDEIRAIPFDKTRIGIELEKDLMICLMSEFPGIKFRHSVKLKAKDATTKAHEEIDILLNYKGKLWVIECKLKKEEDLDEKIKGKIESLKNGSKIKKDGFFYGLEEDIDKMISNNQFMQFKADIHAAKEVSGTFGKVFWAVTSENFNKKYEDFFKDEEIDYVKIDKKNGYISSQTKSSIRKILNGLKENALQ